MGDGQTTHAKRLARAGPSDESARMSLRSGAAPSRLEVPATGKARRLAAKDLAAAKEKIADGVRWQTCWQRPTARARQRASKRMKDAARLCARARLHFESVGHPETAGEAAANPII